MHARERLYLTAGKDRLVPHGDPKAAFLYATVGDEIPASAAEKFGLVDGRLKRAAGKREAMLIGSSVLAAVVAITDKLSVQLGDIVARAHKESGLSVDDWNALAGDDREARLAGVVEAMKAEAAAAPPSTSKPEVKPTPKPEVKPTPKPEPKTATARKAPAKKKASIKAA